MSLFLNPFIFLERFTVYYYLTNIEQTTASASAWMCLCVVRIGKRYILQGWKGLFSMPKKNGPEKLSSFKELRRRGLSQRGLIWRSIQMLHSWSSCWDFIFIWESSDSHTLQYIARLHKSYMCAHCINDGINNKITQIFKLVFNIFVTPQAF